MLVPCILGSSFPSRGLSLPICKMGMLDQLCRVHAHGHAATPTVHLQNFSSSQTETLPPLPSPQALAPTILLPVSVNVSPLGTSSTWDGAVFVP